MRLMMLLIILCLSTKTLAISSYYEKQKEGWFWFEDKEKEEQDKQKQTKITPEIAKKEIEKFKKELDDLYAMWLISPSVENAKKLMEKELEMFSRTERAAKARTLATLIYPYLDDNLKNPSNVLSVRMKRDALEAAKHKSIEEFAKEVDLVLFRSDNCKVSREFEPVLKRFADTYGIRVEAVSSNGASIFFPNKKADNLINTLNIRGTPSVFVVHKNKPIYFELISNHASISELEERVELANEYIKLKLGESL
jgi:hypothetical protein